MSIKFAVLRTFDGHVTDLLRDGANVRAGVQGRFEILPAGNHSVTISGKTVEGTPPKWPDDIKPGKHKVVISGVECEVEVKADATNEPATVPPEVTEPASDASAKHKGKPTA